MGLYKAKLVALCYLSPKKVKEICSVQRLREVQGLCSERFCLGVDTWLKMYLLLVSSDMVELTFVSRRNWINFFMYHFISSIFAYVD